MLSSLLLSIKKIDVGFGIHTSFGETNIDLGAGCVIGVQA
jgi:hypothetical protein